jgi:hypothetical protein
MISEYYSLRRTSIKDLAGYCGFLVGFLGAAPLAWPRLTAEIDRGNLVLGLWYFFGLIAIAAVCTGAIGLGVGFAIGWAWERYHRYRRARRDRNNPAAQQSIPVVPSTNDTPRLHLVGGEQRQSSLLVGRRLNSVRFFAQNVEFEFAGLVIGVSGEAAIIAGATRIAYPEPGSRDAFCRVIGSKVTEMRRSASGDVELDLDSGWGLILPRARAILRAR